LCVCLSASSGIHGTSKTSKGSKRAPAVYAFLSTTWVDQWRNYESGYIVRPKTIEHSVQCQHLSISIEREHGSECDERKTGRQLVLKRSRRLGLHEREPERRKDYGKIED
jgi:hypothetical protein